MSNQQNFPAGEDVRPYLLLAGDLALQEVRTDPLLVYCGIGLSSLEQIDYAKIEFRAAKCTDDPFQTLKRLTDADAFWRKFSPQKFMELPSQYNLRPKK